MIQDFKLNRKVLSSYYISVIFTYFVFLTFGENFTKWIRDLGLFIGENINFDLVGSGRFWYFLVFVSIVFVILLRRFVVEPMGFFVDSDSEPLWESLLLVFLIIGFFLFLFNQSLQLPMPREFPLWFIRLVGGYKNTFLPLSGRTETEISNWWAITYLWYLAPIIFLYVRRKLQIKS